MLSIIKERQLSKEEKEALELEKEAPYKFDPELQFVIQKNNMGEFKEKKYRTLTLSETQALLAASNKPVAEKPKHDVKSNYSTYSREQVEKMVREHFQYKKDHPEKSKKEDDWDSKKTTEYARKTGRTMKRSKYTKR